MASTSTSESAIPELKMRNSSVYEFYNHQPDPDMVIMFFHDMNWSKEERPHVRSWMSRSEPSVCWPKKWLSEKFRKSQILSITYDSSVLRTGTAGHMDLYQIGENLWQDILPGPRECAPNCPIFLVGHGAGGLVIKATILAMREQTWNDKNKRAKAFLNCVKGIVYYSTPHHGSNFADCINCLPTCLLGPLLDPLSVLSKHASRLNNDFARWRRDTKGYCRTTSIFAAHPTRVALGWLIQIVEEASARSDTDDFYTVQCEHRNVCKPKDETDGSFTKLVSFIDQEMDKITRVPPPSSLEVCTKFVEIFLNKTRRYPSEGEFISKEEAEKIQQFPEVWKSLETGLQNAGLKFVRSDETRYVWIRVCK